jgi:GMP synthase-like glutamine amidotransferase
VNRPRLLVIEHEPNCGLDWMGPTLEVAARVEVIRPYLGDAVPTEELSMGDDGSLGLVVLGGSMGAWDDEAAPWLPATRRLLAAAVRAGAPTLGICLGAQLLAAATGGKAERGAPGLEIGLVEVTPLPEAAMDPFLADVAAGVAAGTGGWAVTQYHYDAVTGLPPDAELLVTGKTYPYQAFRVGERAWAVQYHPEVSTAVFVEWVAHGQAAGELPADAAGLLDPVRAAARAQRAQAESHAAALLARFVPGREGDD